MAGEQSQRQLRVSETVRQNLSEILLRTEIQDEDLSGTVITVSEVRISPDMRNATIFIMPLGGERKQEIVDALERHKKFLRGELAHKLHLKYMPDLHFKIDESFETSSRIDEVLNSEQVARDLRK